jgi:5-methyltetrahydrofolate--homocysteine methyltransferase
MVSELPKDFTIIGENVHTTRVLLRKGRRVVTSKDGTVGITFSDPDGRARLLPIPEAIQQAQDYQEGRVKHVKVAVLAAMDSDEAVAACGHDYLRYLVHQQEIAGCHYIDVNVDEISIRLDDQKNAMAWLVGAVQTMTALHISVDSSNIDVIDAGLAACDLTRRPMLNSASLERVEALEFALNYKASVIVTAAGEKGMPTNVEDRMKNAVRMIEAALVKGINLPDIYVDPLIFPIAVNKEFALHSLQTMRELRDRFGPEIHITGGFSNVSFGIPYRSVINDVFLVMAIEAGADCGIIDPVMNSPSRITSLDRNAVAYRLAEDVLLGKDEYCEKFIRAWRQGELDR